MADDVQTVPGEHGKKIAYAKDNMERMPYEYYTGRRESGTVFGRIKGV